jgi:type IV pilus assembly protein PilC
MKSSQKTLLFRRLALYLNAGVPIVLALSFITEDTVSKKSREILKALEKSVATGQPLSAGLMQFPKQFDQFTVGFVYIGETSGNLSETLERLAVALHKRNVLTHKIISALAYPALVLCGTIGITLFLILCIFPKILPVLRSFRTELPFTTQLLISATSFIQNEWWVLLLVIALSVVLGFTAYRYPRVQTFSERVFLGVPIFGSLFQFYSIALFARTMSLQLKGGVRILPALELVRSSLPGRLYGQALITIEVDIAQGRRFSTALRVHDTLFPILCCQMIAAGEATGTLSANLEVISDLYEESLDELTKNLTTLIEPALMVVMGFVVGFVALAIITPIYAVTQNLSSK